MASRVGLVLFTFFLGLGVSYAQPLEAYWRTSPTQPGDEFTEAFEKVEKFVSDHRGPNGPRHLARVFRKFQHAFQKKYEAYADFSSLFSYGTYDCLTATTLLSHVLEKLGYQTEIVETTYHIFIKVHTAEGQILLESTDPVGGFIMGDAAIANRVAGYRNDETRVADRDLGEAAYRYRSSVYRTVRSADLIGLLLYNRAVKAYNQKQWLSSAIQLEASFAQYPSDRCYELAAILLRTIREHAEWAPEEKRACLDHLVPVIIRRSGTVAAN
jgi:hypothetical protein